MNGRQQPNSATPMISITVDSFKDNFLTCATCFGHFNQDVRKAKLLPCSHTVCLPCLRKMEEHISDRSLNCPSCRQSFLLPATGSVDDLPPAFLINNLCELVEKGTREATPFCADHADGRALYCETCDEAFCEMCHASTSKTGTITTTRCGEHVVIPVNTAMSKLHRSALEQVQQCQSALQTAKKSIEQVRRDLSASSDSVVADINKEFDVLRKQLENRRNTLIKQVEAVKSTKERKLVKQLNLVESERNLITLGAEELAKLQKMSSTIKSLSERYNEVLKLCEPEENSYIRYSKSGGDVSKDIVNKLSRVGNISVSTTFPGNCFVKQQTKRVLTHIENEFLIETFEIDNRRRTTGGDPITVSWTNLSDNPDKVNLVAESVEIFIKDCLNGTYLLKSKLKKSGSYLLDVSIFGRPIKNSPLTVRVESSHLPQWKVALPDVGNPLKVFQDHNEEIYVLDEAKELIHVVNTDGIMLKNITLPIRGGATVGMAMAPGKEEMFCLNWRQNTLCKFLRNGTFLQSMAFTDLEVPTDIVSDESQNRLLVADPKSSKIFVFNSDFTPQFNFRISPEQGTVMCVQAGLNGDILVGTSLALLCFNNDGVYQRDVNLASSSNGPNGSNCTNGGSVRLSVPCCVVCPTTRSIVAVVTETMQKEKNKSRSYISVLDYDSAQLRFCISSCRPEFALVRPNGLCVGKGRYTGHVLLVDIHTKSLSAYKFY